MRRMALAAIAFCCGSASLSAATLLLSTGGTYSGSTATSSWTAPGATWSVSFNVSSTPTVNSSISGNNFDTPVTNFVYLLNGSPVSVGPVDVAFYSTAEGGLIDIGLFGSSALSTPANGFVVLGPQAYSGPEASPTILTGAYAETANTLRVASTSFSQTLGSITISGPPPATPAPPSLFLTLVGLALGTAYLTSRRFARS